MARTTKKNEDHTQSPEAAAINEAQNTMAILQTAHSEERDLVNQLLGQAQMADAISKFSRTVRLSKLAFVKENKLYKALAGKSAPDGSALSGTWDEFCQMLGYSKDKVDTDLQNLREFGEEALESMSRMGIGYRELREFRRLPEDEKSALIEVAKNGDKEALVEFAETIFEKHSKDTKLKDKKIADLQADIEAKDAVAETNQQRINELQEKVARIKKMPIDQQDADFRNEISALVTQLDHDLRTNFYNAIEALRNHSGSDHSEFIDAQLKMLADTVQFLQDELSDAEPEWMKEQQPE
jgi:hypothetical protein